jgi:hypothetical protein
VTLCILVRPGREISTHYFSWSCGTGAVSIKSTVGHVTWNLCFASSGIYESHSSFLCIRVRNIDAPFFMLGWDRYILHKKMHLHILRRTSIFASVGISGSRSAFRCIRARNVDTLFFMLKCDQYRFHKKRAGTRYTKLVFFHPVGFVSHVVHFDASQA